MQLPDKTSKASCLKYFMNFNWNFKFKQKRSWTLWTMLERWWNVQHLLHPNYYIAIEFEIFDNKNQFSQLFFCHFYDAYSMNEHGTYSHYVIALFQKKSNRNITIDFTIHFYAFNFLLVNSFNDAYVVCWLFFCCLVFKTTKFNRIELKWIRVKDFFIGL